ncbi:hypothetical protein [Rhizobacter sp. P5_C2]
MTDRISPRNIGRPILQGIKRVGTGAKRSARRAGTKLSGLFRQVRNGAQRYTMTVDPTNSESSGSSETDSRAEEIFNEQKFIQDLNQLPYEIRNHIVGFAMPAAFKTESNIQKNNQAGIERLHEFIQTQGKFISSRVLNCGKGGMLRTHATQLTTFLSDCNAHISELQDGDPRLEVLKKYGSAMNSALADNDGFSLQDLVNFMTGLQALHSYLQMTLNSSDVSHIEWQLPRYWPQPTVSTTD